MATIINHSRGVPGSGKTEAFLKKAKQQISSGKLFLMALPTLDLINEIQGRCQELDLPCRSINDRESDRKRVKSLQGVLERKEPLILTTHSALELVDDTYIEGYTVVIDEVPSALEMDSKTLTQQDMDVLLSHLDKQNGELQILPEHIATVKALIKAYKQAAVNGLAGTTSSEFKHTIFDALIEDGVVSWKALPQKKAYSITTIKAGPIFQKLSKAKEVHLLAANIAGSIFEVVSLAKGFKFARSHFEPSDFNYTGNITLLPLMDFIWSKNRALRTEDGEYCSDHMGIKEKQFIDQAIARAYKHNEKQRILLFKNNWFNSNAVADYSEICICPADTRGKNEYSEYTSAILVYSGKANPNHVPALKAFAEKLGLSGRELVDAWHVSNKLERSAQDVTRTAVRRRNNKENIRLYVQDIEVCEYLIANGMANAKIDKSLMLEVPIKKSGAPQLSNFDWFIVNSLKNSCKKKDIVQGLKRLGMAQSTAYQRINLICRLLGENSEPAVA